MVSKVSALAIFITLNSLGLSASMVSTPLSMEGESLRCCTLVEPPQVFRDASSKYGYGGIAIEYLISLQSKLGFECSSFTNLDGPDVGFTDLVFKFEKCALQNGSVRPRDPVCNCDIAAAGFSINSERIGRVDFLLPYINDDFRVLTHIQNTGISMAPAEKFKPLPREIGWVRQWKHYVLKSEVLYRLRKAAESTFYHLIGQSSKVEGDGTTQRQRILNFVILLTGLFLTLIYEAAMTASLVNLSFDSDFRTIDDFKTCRIPPEQVCVPAGGATEAFWRQIIAARPCHKGSEPNWVSTYAEVIAKTARRECLYATAGGATLLDAAAGRYCGKLAVTGQPFLSGGLSMVLPKGSKWTEVLNNATLQLKASGNLPTIEEYLSRQGECQHSMDSGITFAKLRVFFFVAYAVCGLLLVEMLVDPQDKVKSDRNINDAGGQDGKEDQESVRGVNEKKVDFKVDEQIESVVNDDMFSGLVIA